MSSPAPCLVFVSIAVVTAATLAATGVNVWLALAVSLPAGLALMVTLDRVFAFASNLRNRRVARTECPACNTPLGSSPRWQIVHPDVYVECAACRAVCTFTANGVLVSATKSGVGLKPHAPPDGYRDAPEEN
jgi:hypothetical protein